MIMKTHFYIIFTLFVLSLASCTSEVGAEMPLTGPTLTFNAVHADSRDTKTTLQDNGVNIWWTADEQINIFYGTKFKGQFSSTNSKPQATTSFTGSLTVITGSIETGAADAYWAIYPYSESNTCDGESVTLTVPSAQIGVAGSFADNFFPSIAKSASLDLAFYNVCGGARISVSQSGISSIKISSKNASPLAGKVRVDFGSNGKPEIKEVLEGASDITLSAPAGGFVPGQYYYVAILPGAQAKGLKVSFEKEDNTLGTYEISKSLEVHRSIFGKLSNLDKDLSFVPNPDSPIVFTDLIAKYACVVKYDTNGDGEVSIKEAEAATSFDGLFADWNSVTSFDEIKYFKNVHSLSGVFKGCNKLVSIIVPENITYLGTDTFSNCSSLTSVHLPSGIKSIGNYSFLNCFSLSSVNIPSSVTSVGKYAFSGCSLLTDISLPSGVNSIPQYCFSQCTSLRLIDIPSTVTSIGKSAFESCSSLKQVVIPAGVTTLPSNCFAGCSALTSVIIPEGVISIEAYAFYGVKMWKLNLPSSISSLGSYCFNGIVCIIMPSTSPVSIQPDTFSFLTGTGIFVPSNLIDMYGVMNNWANYATMIHPIDTYKERSEFTLATSGTVDMGSSVKWAAYNLGAVKPEEYGDFFAWGETKPKSNYIWSTYKWCNGTNYKITKYCTNSSYWDSSEPMDNKTILDPEDDAAHVGWGDSWRMPTSEECMALVENCIWEWTSSEGIYGDMVYYFEGGNALFLPAAGFYDGTEHQRIGVNAVYRSSSIGPDRPDSTFGFSSSSVYVGWNYYDRFLGVPIRPVCPKE